MRRKLVPERGEMREHALALPREDGRTSREEEDLVELRAVDAGSARLERAEVEERRDAPK